MLIRSIRLFFFLTLLVIPVHISFAQGQVNLENCVGNIDQAQELLIDGFFDETINLLEPCSRLEGYTATQQTRLFKLMADTYLALQSVSEARNAIERILEISPNFTPDENLDSQTFMNLVSEIRNELLKPNPIQNFNVLEADGTVRLTWASPEGDDEVSRIRILRGGTSDSMAPLDSVGTSAVGYTDNTVEGGQSYFYAIQAIGVNGIASDLTQRVQVSIPAPPEDAIPVEVAGGTAEDKKKPNRKALFIGGGVLVAGGIAAAVLLGGDDPDDPMPPTTGADPLPGPPSIP